MRGYSAARILRQAQDEESLAARILRQAQDKESFSKALMLSLSKHEGGSSTCHFGRSDAKHREAGKSA